MKCLLLQDGSREILDGGEELLDRWSEEPNSLIWVEINGPLSERHEQILTSRFKLHPLAIQDAKRDRHPPKLESFDDFTFLIFKTLTVDSVDIHFSTIQLAMFVGERFLVTRTSGPSQAIDRLKRETLQNPAKFSSGPWALAARLMRVFVNRYLEIILALEPELEKREQGLLERTGDSVLAELTGYKTDLKRLRRIFLYHEQVLDRLRRHPLPGFPAEGKHELNDCYEQQERANSLTLLYYELASDLIDGYLSLSAHRLNGIMKVLTIVTVVFVPLGFLAGIYGMNFEHMPELGSKWGYYILLSVMASLAITLLLVFRKRKWL